MPGGEVEGDAVALIAQEGLAAGLGLEDAVFAFVAEVAGKAALPGDQPDHAFGKMYVEIVGDDLPSGFRRIACDQGLQEGGEVLFGASRADRALDRAGCDVEGSDQGLGTVADVLVFPPLDEARRGPQARCGALKRLDTAHLVE